MWIRNRYLRCINNWYSDTHCTVMELAVIAALLIGAVISVA